ncbi:MAG: hypothetical protein HQM08_03805 [Candidatus Riflebacteria bacterium]|nr:hypothetical protein [Candidatus Riflebacteria bacterium]
MPVREEEKPPEIPLLPLIIVGLAFIPLFFLVLWPYYTVNQIIETQNIPEKDLLFTPTFKEIREYGVATLTFNFSAWGMKFPVPEDFLPIMISPTEVFFRETNRINSKALCIRNMKSISPNILPETFVEKWFIPTDPYNFFETVLNSTWNPIRLLCKARFLETQDIRGDFYKTEWNKNLKGFIFPSPGKIGYVARIFNGKDISTFFEFAFDDPIYPIKLSNWMKLASAISISAEKDSIIKEWKEISFEKLAEKLENNKLNLSVENLLNLYFVEKDEKWIFAIAYYLEKRGFFRETIDFFRIYGKKNKENNLKYQAWKKLAAKCFSNFLMVAVEKKVMENKLLFRFENTGRFFLKNIRILIFLETMEETKKIGVNYFTDYSLQYSSARSFVFDLPQNISLSAVTSIKSEVEDADFFE